jgi:nucleoside-diphosphate-sugar epimerase
MKAKEIEMKVLITGGTGFIGSRLALNCLDNGNEVKVLGRENNQAEAENKRLIETRGAQVILESVTNKKAVFEAVHGVDVVYHLAAAQHEANVPDQIFWDVNVTGTKNMLEASVAAGVKRFVHGSTIGVYGFALEGSVNEDSPLRPDNIYGVTKLEAENVVLSFQKELPVVIIRISETYGPGDRRLLKLFKGIKKNIFFMIGKGENMHHLIYIDDLIEALFLATESQNAIGKIFVVAGKDALTSNEMVEVIAEQLGTKIPRFRAPLSLFLVLAVITESILRPLRIQPPLHRRRMNFFRKSFTFSQEEATRILGFLPKVGFEQGVGETKRWYEGMGYL